MCRADLQPPMIANDDGTYRKNLTFDFIAHFSRYILPRAKRIGFSKCDTEIEMTAAKNEDGVYCGGDLK